MTRDEYYELLKKKMEQTDMNSQESLHEYNEYARQLRDQMEWEQQ